MVKTISVGIFSIVVLGLLLQVNLIFARATKDPAAKELESRIGALEKRQIDLERGQDISSKVREAQWDLTKVLLQLVTALVVGGIGIYFAVHGALVNRLKGDVVNLTKKFENELAEKLAIHTKSGDMRLWRLFGDVLDSVTETYPLDSAQRSKLLNVAKQQYEEALAIAEGLPESDPERERKICILKNNLADLLTRGGAKYQEKAREYALYAYERAPKYPTNGFHWEDTYGWVLVVFARNGEERQKGVHLLEELYRRPALMQGWVTERKKALRELLEKS